MPNLFLNPLYIPLIQKPFCCAVTCLQTLLYRNGYGLYDQEDLAIKLGVKISPEDAPAFRENMPIMTQANFDEGISTIDSSALVNNFFTESDIALKASRFPFSAIPNLHDFLISHLKSNHDLWIEYHGHNIHSNDRFKGNYIHDGLVEGYNTDTKIVTITDPMPDHRQRLEIPLDVVSSSISTLYGRETGFLIISSLA